MKTSSRPHSGTATSHLNVCKVGNTKALAFRSAHPAMLSTPAQHPVLLIARPLRRDPHQPRGSRSEYQGRWCGRKRRADRLGRACHRRSSSSKPRTHCPGRAWRQVLFDTLVFTDHAVRLARARKRKIHVAICAVRVCGRDQTSIWSLSTMWSSSVAVVRSQALKSIAFVLDACSV